MRSIELLAPAKNIEIGKIAINYGADAVYIGADRFGARAAAGNSVSDIENLVKFAHKYGAKVFVTLNTILFENELEEAEKLIHEVYHAGADALIIQDMGILEMDLPPIALHASTQSNNFDLNRIKFLDKMGFERLVLARELNLEEIRTIRETTQSELEFFIHGALCVSLSGQCYFSQAVTGRSANRGMCAQMCRHPYNLIDGVGNKIVSNSHLLSLKDLNNAQNLESLIDAGISSLKIEGRLKDEHYVKNIVSYYRQKLDDIIISRTDLKRASIGTTQIQFEPDPQRSFNRKNSDYFLQDRKQDLVNKVSPKSMGKFIGVINHIEDRSFRLTSDEKINNGDGLCFIKGEELLGIRVETCEGDRIKVSSTEDLSIGQEIYRNYDHQFLKKLESDNSIRKVSVSIRVIESSDSLEIILKDEDELMSPYRIEPKPEKAKQAESYKSSWQKQLSKSGDSMFQINEVRIDTNEAYFMRMSELNEIRRQLFEAHEAKRIEQNKPVDRSRRSEKVNYPQNKLSFAENVSNSKAKAFYMHHGVSQIEDALEISEVKTSQTLMTTRYCVKYELGYCKRFQKSDKAIIEPLYLEDKNRKYLLEFDCKNCFMKVKMV